MTDFSVGIPYQAFSALPDRGLTCIANSRALGSDVRELRVLELAHRLTPGDLVHLDGYWWLLDFEGWRAADPSLMENPPEYGGVLWSPSLANSLLAQAAGSRRTRIRNDSAERKLGRLLTRTTA
jgi:hypothetical protein